MKRLALIQLILSACLGAHAQGTVQFSNLDAGAGLNSPIYLNDGTTKVGAGFTAVLFAGPSPTSLQQIATTPLLSGSQAGYFQGGMQSIPTVPGGSNVFITIGVFDSGFNGGFISFWAAYQAGQLGGWPNIFGLSSNFAVKTGGDTNASPATAPAVLIGLQSFNLNPGYLDIQPWIFQTYDPVKRSVTVSFTHTLEVSTDLIHWATVIGGSPEIFPATQAQQYFRINYP